MLGVRVLCANRVVIVSGLVSTVLGPSWMGALHGSSIIIITPAEYSNTLTYSYHTNHIQQSICSQKSFPHFFHLLFLCYLLLLFFLLLLFLWLLLFLFFGYGVGTRRIANIATAKHDPICGPHGRAINIINNRQHLYQLHAIIGRFDNIIAKQRNLP